MPRTELIPIRNAKPPADFERGWLGIGSREQFFARYADLLTIPSSDRARLAEQRMPIGFLDYDWR